MIHVSITTGPCSGITVTARVTYSLPSCLHKHGHPHMCHSSVASLPGRPAANCDALRRLRGHSECCRRRCRNAAACHHGVGPTAPHTSHCRDIRCEMCDFPQRHQKLSLLDAECRAPNGVTSKHHSTAVRKTEIKVRNCSLLSVNHMQKKKLTPQHCCEKETILIFTIMTTVRNQIVACCQPNNKSQIAKKESQYALY